MAVTSERLNARACKSSYVVLGVIFGFIFVMGIWQMTVPGGDWRLILLMGAAFFLTMLWIGTIRIRYSECRSSYYTLFRGTQSVMLEDTRERGNKIDRNRQRFVPIVIDLSSAGKAQETNCYENQTVLQRGCGAAL